MTNLEIQQNNKLIAVFMGAIIKKDIDGVEQVFNLKEINNPAGGCSPINIDDLRYYSSWDWLMPVLEKICRMQIGDGKEYIDYPIPRTFGMINEETGQIMVRLNGFRCFNADTLIEAVWLAVIDFIININS